MLATDRAAYAEMPADTLKGITGISGLHDLEPVLLSHVNEPLQLTEASAERNSPVRQPLPTSPPAALLAHGGLESDEYSRQALAYAEALRKAGDEPVSMGIEGHHHFSVLNAFAKPDHRFCCAVCLLSAIVFSYAWL